MTIEAPNDVERRFELALAVDRIQGDDNAAGFPDAELRHHELRAVGKQQRDPVARTHADRGQGRGKGIALLFQFAVGHRRALEQQRRRVSLARARAPPDSRAASDRGREQAWERRRRRSAPASVSRGLRHDRTIRLQRYASSVSSSAFWVCRRFSAWSKTTDAGDSKTSAVTSSPRCAGRQCMKSAPRRRRRHQRAVDLIRLEDTAALGGFYFLRPSTSTRRCRRHRRQPPPREGP